MLPSLGRKVSTFQSVTWSPTACWTPLRVGGGVGGCKLQAANCTSQVSTELQLCSRPLQPVCWALKTFSRRALDQWAVASGLEKLLLEVHPPPRKKKSHGLSLCSCLETVTSLLAKTLNPKNGNGAHTASTPGKMRGSESTGPWGCKDSDTTERLTLFHFQSHFSSAYRAPSLRTQTRVGEERQWCNFSAQEGETQRGKSPKLPLAGANATPRTRFCFLCHQKSYLSVPVSTNWRRCLLDKTARIRLLIYHGNDWNNAHCWTKQEVSRKTTRSPNLSLTTRIPYLGQDKFLKSLEVGNGLSNSKR